MKEALQLIAAHEASAAMMLPAPGRDDMWQTVRQMHLSTAAVLRALVAPPSQRMKEAGAGAIADGVFAGEMSACYEHGPALEAAAAAWKAMHEAIEVEITPTSVDLLAGLRAQRDEIKAREAAHNLLLRDARLNAQALSHQIGMLRKERATLQKQHEALTRTNRRLSVACWCLPAAVAALATVHQFGWRSWWPFP